MRKNYSLIFSFLLLANAARATTFDVQVTSNQFTPANIPNVVVGDVIRFQFVNGFHNATSENVSNAVPANAALINSGVPSGVNPRSYSYTVTQPGDYKYICQVHATAATFTGMVGTFTASASLPVSLKSFNVITTANKPSFTWVTATEENVSHFLLKSSYDGFKYEDAGRVAAIGNSTTEQTYSFTHTGVSVKYRYVYYMLAIVDRDGKQKLSKVLVFKNPVATNGLITQLGPNPLKRPNQLMIQFNAEKQGKILARVFDAGGKKVLESVMSAYPGLNNGHIHLCDLSPGIYNIQFTLDGIKENKRVVVQ